MVVINFVNYQKEFCSLLLVKLCLITSLTYKCMLKIIYENWLEVSVLSVLLIIKIVTLSLLVQFNDFSDH